MEQPKAVKIAKEWLSAGLACVVADSLFNPLEVIKTRKQLFADPSLTSFGIARRAIEKEGLFVGLWQPGLLATWMRGMSYTGFRIGCYPRVRDWVSSQLGGDSLLTRILAGALTGSIGSCLFAPIDVVRIRMQSTTPYSSTFAGFGQVVRDGGGIRALWRGASPSVLRASLLSGSQLASYDTSKRHLRSFQFFIDENGQERIHLHLIASLISGFCGQTVAMPADAARTLIMARGSLHAGQHPLQVLQRAYRQEGGLRVFYRGYFPALMRQGPVMLVQMPLVEKFRVLAGLNTI